METSGSGSSISKARRQEIAWRLTYKPCSQLQSRRQRVVRKETREDRGARLSRTYHSVKRIDQEIKNYGLLAKYGPSLGFVKATS